MKNCDSRALRRPAEKDLRLDGSKAVYEGPPAQDAPETAVTYYGSSLKGAYADRLAWILRRETVDIQLEPRPEGQTADYGVILAADYNPSLDYLGGPAGVGDGQ